MSTFSNFAGGGIPQNVYTPPPIDENNVAVDNIRIVLENNKDKDFIKRIISPKDYPVINNQDGSVSTHLMASGEVDGKGIVFPTIIHENGKLKKLDMEDAFKYALKNKQFISFPSPQDANFFAKNYKKAWN